MSKIVVLVLLLVTLSTFGYAQEAMTTSTGATAESSSAETVAQAEGENIQLTRQPVRKVLQTTDKLVLEPIGKVKDATNEALDGKMELVGSEESSEEGITAPKFKVTF